MQGNLRAQPLAAQRQSNRPGRCSPLGGRSLTGKIPLRLPATTVIPPSRENADSRASESKQGEETPRIGQGCFF